MIIALKALLVLKRGDITVYEVKPIDRCFHIIPNASVLSAGSDHISRLLWDKKDHVSLRRATNLTLHFQAL